MKKFLKENLLFFISLSTFSLLLLCGLLSGKDLYDAEISSWDNSNYHAAEIIQGKYYDISYHPFLYYLVLKFWSLFSIAPQWLRLLPLIFSLSSVVLFYKIVSKLFDKRTTIISMLLYSTSAYRLFWSLQYRQYPILLFFELLYFFLFIHLLQYNNFLLWILLTITGTLGFLIDYSFFWLFIPLNIYFIFVHMKKRGYAEILACINSGLMTFILISPFLFKALLAIQTNPQYSIFNKLNHPSPTEPLAHLWYSIFSLYLINGENIHQVSAQGLFVIVTTFLIIYGFKYFRESRGMQLVILLTCLPIVSSSIVTNFIASILVDYQILIVSVTMVIVLGRVLARRNIFSIAIFLLIWSFINLTVYKNYVLAERKEDWKSALEFIHHQLRKNDTLIFLPAYSEQSYRYFSKLYKYSSSFVIYRDTENIFNINGFIQPNFCVIVSYNGIGVSQNILAKLQNDKNFKIIPLKGIKIFCKIVRK